MTWNRKAVQSARKEKLTREWKKDLLAQRPLNEPVAVHVEAY
jgi:hypothetical protein